MEIVQGSRVSATLSRTQGTTSVDKIGYRIVLMGTGTGFEDSRTGITPRSPVQSLVNNFFDSCNFWAKPAWDTTGHLILHRYLRQQKGSGLHGPVVFQNTSACGCRQAAFSSWRMLGIGRLQLQTLKRTERNGREQYSI